MVSLYTNRRGGYNQRDMPKPEPRRFHYAVLKTNKGVEFWVILVAAEQVSKPGALDYVRALFSDLSIAVVLATLPENPSSRAPFEFFGDPSLTAIARSRISLQTQWLEGELPPLQQCQSSN